LFFFTQSQRSVTVGTPVAKDPHDRTAKLASYEFYVLKKKNANTKTYRNALYSNPSDCHLANKTLFSFSFHVFLFFSRHLTLHVFLFCVL
jgi:hypothetical protein